MFIELFPSASPHQAPPDAHVPSLHKAGLLVREAVCAMRGHDYFRHTEGTRIFLRCADCGHETHGWYMDIHC